jgi:hypothetical protein
MPTAINKRRRSGPCARSDQRDADERLRSDSMASWMEAMYAGASKALVGVEKIRFAEVMASVWRLWGMLGFDQGLNV